MYLMNSGLTCLMSSMFLLMYGAKLYKYRYAGPSTYLMFRFAFSLGIFCISLYKLYLHLQWEQNHHGY